VSSDRRSSIPRWAGALAIAGAVAFIGVVGTLHALQPGYDPVDQLMSELALGPHGWAMLVAFALLAASTLSLGLGIAEAQRAPWLQAVLAVAALGFLGAGVFPLGRASEWHIVLIAVAFVAVVLAMYLLPTLAPARFGGMAGKISWLLAAGTALGVFLGHSVLPIGVGQRLAAVCVVAWLCFVGARLCRAPDGVDP
jgi:hypothetical membrane protein